MIVLARTLRDGRRADRWWALGVAGLVAFTAALWPSIEGDTSFDDLTADLPEAMRALMGLEEGISLSVAPGYLHARVFSLLLPLILLIFAVGRGARSIGGREEDGTLELLLANPVGRADVAVERALALVVEVVALGALGFVALLAFGLPIGLLDGVSIVGAAGATAGATALALLFGAISFAVGAVTGRRGPGLAVAAALAAAGYLLQGVSAVTDVVDILRFANPWHWYLGRNMLLDGVAVEAVLAPVALTGALVVAGVRGFTSRDLR